MRSSLIYGKFHTYCPGKRDCGKGIIKYWGIPYLQSRNEDKFCEG